MATPGTDAVVTMAAIPARMMRSVDEVTGSACMVGSHVSASQMRGPRDTQIQTE
jgi:D-aminopeptidase